MKPLYEDEPLFAWGSVLPIAVVLCALAIAVPASIERGNEIAALSLAFVGISAIPNLLRPDVRHGERHPSLGLSAFAGGVIAYLVLGQDEVSDGVLTMLVVLCLGLIAYSYVDFFLYLRRRRAAQQARSVT